MQTQTCPTQAFGLSAEICPANANLPNRDVRYVDRNPEMEAIDGRFTQHTIVRKVIKP